MDVNKRGKSNIGEQQENNLSYTYHRISTYDPNMCSTARYLDNVLADSNDSDQIKDEEGRSIMTTEVQVSFPVPNVPPVEQDTAVFNNKGEPTTGIYQIMTPSTIPSDGNRFVHHVTHNTPLASVNQSAHIIFQRSNGQIYQNYLVNQDAAENGIVELIQIADSSGQIYEQEFTQAKNCHELPAVEYNYQPKIPNNGDLMENFADTAFVHLESAMIPEQTQEFLSESYTQMSSANPVNMNLHHKDQQRILLESTMSPLLAAVNDITQRDAELQSHLNQTLARQIESKDNGISHLHSEKEKISKDFPRKNLDSTDNYVLVADKPVENRARASLPSSFLYFGKSKSNPEETSVFAKKEISLRTKFGPFEGEEKCLSKELLDEIQSGSTHPILYLDTATILDFANEKTSNWMRFVKLAKTFREQNLLLYFEYGKFYFKCSRAIKAKEELRVGYCEEYAKMYDLRILTLTENEIKIIYEEKNPWLCFECYKRFPSSQEMQKHLSVHEVDDEKIESRQNVRHRRKKSLKKFLDVRKNSNRCRYCLKVFMTNVSLRKHVAQHLAEKRSGKNVSRTLRSETSYFYKCNTCNKKFYSEEKLKNHKLVHTKNELKVNNRAFQCVFCPEIFKCVMQFRNHVAIHSLNGIYTCNVCKKDYNEYHLVRKHIRIFHQPYKHSCNECGRGFTSMSFLRRHKVSHSEKKEFLCSECGKQIKRKDKLREHVQRMHRDGRGSSRKKKRNENNSSSLSDMPPYSELRNIKDNLQNNKEPPPDFHNFVFKCTNCMIGFKRRGMLVNHLVKRHPEVRIDSIPELNEPIVKPQSLFFCQYCPKAYKSNGKRKVHILKNHPGQDLPPSARNQSDPEKLNARMIGNIKTDPQRCQLCYKQYATRNRLLAHYKKAHPGKEVTESNKQEYISPDPEIYRAPNSPENKLLKLSSAALELSYLEDRKFFEFLNERSQDQSSIAPNNSFNSNGFSKVDVNFKVVDGEFSETSSNADLNRLPQLFDESITCI